MITLGRLKHSKIISHRKTLNSATSVRTLRLEGDTLGGSGTGLWASSFEAHFVLLVRQTGIGLLT